MKFFFSLFFVPLTTLSLCAQNLYYEQSNGTSTTFGNMDMTIKGTNTLRSNVTTLAAFDPEEGWEILAVDGSKYYLQITDSTSSNYGQIDYWDAKTNIRENYGYINAIFEDPTYWTLGGVDNGILYFSSGAEDAEVVSWDGTTKATFTVLSDFLGTPKHWKLAGFHDGRMYVEWSHDSDQSISIRTWNGSTTESTYDISDYYLNHDDAYLFGVTDYEEAIDNDNCSLIVPFGVLASSYEDNSTNAPNNTLDGDPNSRWSANGEGQYIVYDMGGIYDLCTMDINFYNAALRLNYYDFEVSTDGENYETVFQNMSNSMTTELFDNYWISRTARYVKIIGRGNTSNRWIAIEEIKFYQSSESTLSTNKETLANEALISVYPVPASNQLFVSGLEKEVQTAAIYDMAGSLLQTVDLNNSEDALRINTTAYANGIYFLKLSSTKAEVVKRFVIGNKS